MPWDPSPTRPRSERSGHGNLCPKAGLDETHVQRHSWPFSQCKDGDHRAQVSTKVTAVHSSKNIMVQYPVSNIHQCHLSSLWSRLMKPRFLLYLSLPGQFNWTLCAVHLVCQKSLWQRAEWININCSLKFACLTVCSATGCGEEMSQMLN